MSDERYFLVALMGTQDGVTGEFPVISLYAKESDLAELPSFIKTAPEGFTEEPENGWTGAGVMAIFDPELKTFKPVQVYARFKDWLDLSITASEHVTGRGDD